MKKIILGTVAAFALSSFGVARAEDAPPAGGDAKPAKEKKGGKKGKKKKAEDEAPKKAE